MCFDELNLHFVPQLVVSLERGLTVVLLNDTINLQRESLRPGTLMTMRTSNSSKRKTCFVTRASAPMKDSEAKTVLVLVLVPTVAPSMNSIAERVTICHCYKVTIDFQHAALPWNGKHTQ